MLNPYEQKKLEEQARFDAAAEWLAERDHPQVKARRTPRGYAARPRPGFGWVPYGATTACLCCRKSLSREMKSRWSVYCSQGCFIQGASPE